MSTYINQSLGKDEKIIYEAKISNFNLVPHMLLCMFGIGLFTLPMQIIKNHKTELCVTNKKIFGKTGVFSTKTMESPLNKINNVTVNESLGGKIFNYGTLTISTSSGVYRYDSVSYPEQFRSALMQQIDTFEEDKIKNQAMEMAKLMK